MNAGIKALIILVPALLATGMTSTAAAEIDPRLAPASEIYSKKSREILRNSAQRKGAQLATYQAKVEWELRQLTAEPKMESYSENVSEGNINKRVSRTFKAPSKDLSPNKAAGKEMAALLQVSAEIKEGIVAPVPPPGLSMKQATRHTEVVKSMNATQKAATKAREQLDRQYLGMLDKLMSASDTDAVMAAQIEEQKKQVLSGTPIPITNLKDQLPGTRWQRIEKPTEFLFFPITPVMFFSYSATVEGEVVLTVGTPKSRETITRTWKLSEDGTMLLKDGTPDLRLVHPDPKDFMKS